MADEWLNLDPRERIGIANGALAGEAMELWRTGMDFTEIACDPSFVRAQQAIFGGLLPDGMIDGIVAEMSEGERKLFDELSEGARKMMTEIYEEPDPEVRMERYGEIAGRVIEGMVRTSSERELDEGA